MNFSRFFFVSVAAFVSACGSIAPHKSDAGAAKAVGFVATDSRYGSYSCGHAVAFDGSPVIKVTRTCGDGLDSNAANVRTYATGLDVQTQATLAQSLLKLDLSALQSRYAGEGPDASKWGTYTFTMLTADGNAVAVEVERAAEEKLPEGLREVYQCVAGGNVRSLQDVNDAFPELVAVTDEDATQAEVTVLVEISGGWGFQGCSCDGNDKVPGYFATTAATAADGSQERYQGCHRTGTTLADPRRGERCNAAGVSTAKLAPSTWLAVKKTVLASGLNSLARDYPCGSYVNCPSDYAGRKITIAVGQSRYPISWIGSTEDQLPARLQLLLKTLLP